MRKEIIKVSVLLSAILLTCVALIWLTPLPPSNYFGVIHYKHQLLERTPSPRIIFIGDSNLAFGIDGRIIHETLNRNVVNMGLHAGLGLRYVMNEIKDNIKPGDIIVVVQNFYLNLGCDQNLLEVILYYPDGTSYLGFPEYVTLTRKFPIALQRRFEGYFKNFLFDSSYGPGHPAYNKHNFDMYGDNIGHLGRHDLKLKKQKLDIQRDPTDVAEALNQFSTYAAQKGAQLVLSFPPSPQTYFKPEEHAADHLYTWLKNNLHFPIIGTPRDFVFPDDFFYDTIYHLNERGRRERTIILAGELAKMLREHSELARLSPK
ncbi:MAG: hypothetical protein ACM3SY_05545 [Candidatus Omnitrophota bacterium]